MKSNIPLVKNLLNFNNKMAVKTSTCSNSYFLSCSVKTQGSIARIRENLNYISDAARMPGV
jgi:hypothetical protein